MRLKKTPCSLAIVILLAAISTGHAQTNSATPFVGYYYDYKLANPAFTGIKVKHLINTVYSGVVQSFPQELFYGSYELDAPGIRSGFGGLALIGELGPSIRTNLALMYRRQISFSETSGLNIGTQISYQRRKIDYSKFDFVDPGDPMLSSGEEKQTLANIDLGLLFYSQAISLGVGGKNLLRHYGEATTFNMIATREFDIIGAFKINPSIFLVTDFNETSIALNSTFELGEWTLLGGGYRYSSGGQDDVTFNMGLNIRGWVQIVAHMYSSAQNRYEDSGPRIETMVRVLIPHSDR